MRAPGRFSAAAVLLGVLTVALSGITPDGDVSQRLAVQSDTAEVLSQVEKRSGTEIVPDGEGVPDAPLAVAPRPVTEAMRFVPDPEVPEATTPPAAEVPAVEPATETAPPPAAQPLPPSEQPLDADGGPQPAVAPPVTPSPRPEPTPTPTTPPPPPAVDDPATRGARALALVGYPWQQNLPGWSIGFLEGQDGLRGLTYSGEQRIEVYVRPGDSDWDIARVIAHELGHAADLTLNDTGDRRRWKQQRGIGDDIAWWPGSGGNDFGSGAGDFAECFATWQMGSASLSAVGGPCTASDLDLMIELTA